MSDADLHVSNARLIIESTLEPAGVKSTLQGLLDEIERLRTALGFARSVIKSGEPWTETCEQMLSPNSETEGTGN